jgi:uncharacterized membrane protein
MTREATMRRALARRRRARRLSMLAVALVLLANVAAVVSVPLGVLLLALSFGVYEWRSRAAAHAFEVARDAR